MMAAEPGDASQGTLWVAATPIGNLSDLTDRVRERLREADLVFAEDTRRTAKLLHHLGAEARLRSLHEHNEEERIPELLAALAAGSRCVLVSDAGSPAVSDPGRRAVAAARAAGHAVVPLPGPSAVTAALSVAGLPADRFLFLGFAPRRGPERAAWMGRARTSPDTVVAFESPHRLSALLAQWVEAGMGGRRCVVCRELTKAYEDTRAGTVTSLAAYYTETSIRGEVTLVLEAAEPEARSADPEEVGRVVKELAAEGRSTREIARALQRRFGLSRNEAYGRALGEDVDG